MVKGGQKTESVSMGDVIWFLLGFTVYVLSIEYAMLHKRIAL